MLFPKNNDVSNFEQKIKKKIKIFIYELGCRWCDTNYNHY